MTRTHEGVHIFQRKEHKYRSHLLKISHSTHRSRVTLTYDFFQILEPCVAFPNILCHSPITYIEWHNISYITFNIIIYYIFVTCYHRGILLPSLAISLHDFSVVRCTYTRTYAARRKCFKTNGSTPANELEATRSCLLDRFMYRVSQNMWLTLFHKRIRAQDFPRSSFIFRVIKNLILS